MTLLEAIALANSGALLMRASDKHARDWPWRVVAPVDLDALGVRLVALRPGQMLGVPGLKRKSHDGRWLPAGLMSHQAKADDWQAHSEALSRDALVGIEQVPQEHTDPE